VASTPWHGIGLIERGVARQDRDLELIRSRDRWGAAIYWTGHVHPTAQAMGWLSDSPPSKEGPMNICV